MRAIVKGVGGDIDEDLRPFSYWTRTGSAAQDSATRALALAFGLDPIIVRDLDVTNPARTRSLSSYSLSKARSRSLRKPVTTVRSRPAKLAKRSRD